MSDTSEGVDGAQNFTASNSALAVEEERNRQTKTRPEPDAESGKSLIECALEGILSQLQFK
jgi:hypothetical protein